jgi:hypothetical protein
VKQLRTYSAAKPAERPERFPENIWPLWFAPNAFAHTRRFTSLFIAALLISGVLQDTVNHHRPPDLTAEILATAGHSRNNALCPASNPQSPPPSSLPT